MIWKEVLNNVWPYIRNFKAKAIIAVVLSFVLALLGGAQVRLVRPLFDKGLSPDATNQEVLILVGMLLGIGLLHFPARFFHFYLIRFVVDRATCLVREDLFRKFQKLPLSFFSKSKQGELISQVMNDTAIFAQGFRAIIDLLREPLKASVFLGMAFWSDWQLALVIIAISPFLVGIFSLTGKRVKGYQGVVQEKIAGLTHNVTEGLSAQKISKAFNLENFIKGRFVKSQDDFFYSQMKTTKVEEVAHPLVEIIGTFAFCGVIYFA
ncbi:MAG: ABC transporter transmembrane domain-containing protein, partial [Bacteriovoracaceae bacterium]